MIVVFGAWHRQTSILTALAATGIAGIAAGAGARLYWFALHPTTIDDLLALNAGFSSFGAIMGGGAAVAALRYPLFDDARQFRRTLDAMVPAGLAGLAFARLGCIANGCDYGTPTDAPWGIRYHAGTEIVQRHELLGYISSADFFSAPVHPLPIYLIGAIIIAVFATNWMLRPAGAAAGWATIIYASLRAIAETFRSPASITEIFGLNLGIVAALCLASCASLWLVFVYRTRDDTRRPGASK